MTKKNISNLDNIKNKKHSSSYKKTDIHKLSKSKNTEKDNFKDKIKENTDEKDTTIVVSDKHPTINTDNKLFNHLKKYKFYYLPAFIIILTLIAYLKAFNNDFVNWDDDRYVTLNPYITEFSFENIKYFFTNFYFVMYIPITMISYMFDYQIAALDNPAVYHTHNIILHIVNTVLVFILIYQIIKKTNKNHAVFYALISSLVFGVHPMHVESVTWIAERKDVLFTLFYLASLILYMLYIKDYKLKFYFISLVLFLLSLFSKTQAVVLSVSMVLIDYLIGRIDLSKENIKGFLNEKRYLNERVINEKIPFFILSSIFGLLAIFAIGTEEPLAESFSTVSTSSNEPYPFFENFLYSCYSFTHYIIKLIIPQNLSAIHPYPQKPDDVIPLKFWLYPIPVLLIIFYLIRAFLKDKKTEVFSILFFTVNIILVLQLASVQNFLLSEHYAYIPAIGLSILMVYLHFKLIEKNIKLKPVLNTFWVIYIGFLTIFTFFRNDVWQNSLTLWDNVQKQYPEVIVAHYNRGNYNQELGDKSSAEGNTEKALEYYQEAITDYTEAIELHSTNIGALSNRGITKAKIGNAEGAIVDFNKVIAIDSTYGNIFSNKGNALIMLNKYDSAIICYTKALELKPEFEDAYFNRGVAYNSIGKFNEAIVDYTYLIDNNSKTYQHVYLYRAVAYYSISQYEKGLVDIDFYLKTTLSNYKAYYYRALINYKLGKTELAEQDLQLIATNFPEASQEISDEGSQLEINGDYTGQMSYYQQADEKYQISLKINPNNAETYIKQGVLYGKMNNLQKAISNFDKAIELDSANYEAYTNRGFAKDLSGNQTEALKDYTKAISINPEAKLAYFNRGITYNSQNKYNLAIEDFTKVIALDSTYSIAYINRGLSYYKSGQTNFACADWQEALNLGYSQAQTYLNSYCK